MHSFQHNSFRYEAFFDQHETQAVPSRMLAWGQHNVDWIKQMGSSLSCSIVGHPGYDIIEVPRRKTLKGCDLRCCSTVYVDGS